MPQGENHFNKPSHPGRTLRVADISFDRPDGAGRHRGILAREKFA